MSVTKLQAFISDESGATAIEYGLLAGMVAVAIIVSFTLVGNNLQDLFNNGTAEVLAEQTAKIP